MALVNGSDYDHIDLHSAAGGDVTRHMLKDAQARQGVTDLRSAISLENLSSPAMWELGNIGLSSGNNTSANPDTRMRTIGFLSDNIASISKLSGNYVLYAYAGSTYMGHWNGTGFDTTTVVETLTDVDLDAIKTLYPTYNYRLVWYVSNSYTPVPSTDYANIILNGELYTKLNDFDERITATEDDVAEVSDDLMKLAAETAIGSINNSGMWESGQIGTSSGDNRDSQSRMRTKGYLPDCASKISATTGKFVLLAYDPTAQTPYIGVWTGSGFEPSTTYSSLHEFDLAPQKTQHPNYQYRLMWYLSSSYTPDPATDYANVVIYNELSGRISDVEQHVDDVESEIDEVIANQDRINNENFIGNLSNADLWESGQIGTSSGDNRDSQSRMRTKGYISDYTYQISTESGYFILFAYDPTAEDPYVGVWTGEEFEKVSSGYSSLPSFVLANIKTTYPNYKYRLVWYLSSSYTPVPATDYANVLIENEKTAIAHGVTLNGAKIVNMGDSIFGLHFAPVDISTFISQATGATCYNCAFPGTRAVTRSENIGKQKFDLTTLVDAIISGDFSAQDAVRQAATGSTEYDHLPTLESVDFNTVDIITLSYGTNDYGGDVVIGAAGNGNASTFIGAMQEAIGKLETAFPKARIFVCTPIYRSWHNESSYENADTRQNANNNTLLDFVNAVKTVGQAEYIDCIDNHWIGINAKTRTTYTTDGTHPNEDGRRLIARHMAKELY